MEERICPVCKETVPEDTDVCPNCGASYAEVLLTAFHHTPEEEPVAAVLRCKLCDSKLTPGTKFCAVCGAPVTNSYLAPVEEEILPEAPIKKSPLKIAAFFDVILFLLFILSSAFWLPGIIEKYEDSTEALTLSSTDEVATPVFAVCSDYSKWVFSLVRQSCAAITNGLYSHPWSDASTDGLYDLTQDLSFLTSCGLAKAADSISNALGALGYTDIAYIDRGSGKCQITAKSKDQVSCIYTVTYNMTSGTLTVSLSEGGKTVLTFDARKTNTSALLLQYWREGNILLRLYVAEDGALKYGYSPLAASAPFPEGGNEDSSVKALSVYLEASGDSISLRLSDGSFYNGSYDEDVLDWKMYPYLGTLPRFSGSGTVEDYPFFWSGCWRTFIKNTTADDFTVYCEALRNSGFTSEKEIYDYYYVFTNEAAGVTAEIQYYAKSCEILILAGEKNNKASE